MGVPVVSLVGDRHSSRVGLSLLTATGHAEWAVERTEDYIHKAIALASDRAHRAQLRSGLRRELMHSIIYDHIGQASRFEAALRQAWQIWCCSQK